MDGIPPSSELRHLRYFLAAAERGSLRKAAAIGVHESAISRRIRDLEDEIGASLIVRHTGGVTLTLAFMDFAVKEHLIERNPAAGLRLASDGVRRQGQARAKGKRCADPTFRERC